jgi:predicted DNA-binding transcriptional regulator AlpA
MSDEQRQVVERNTQSATEAQLFSPAECVKMCQISRRTWFRINASGKCPACVRVGASPRWRMQDLLDWISWNCPSRKTFEAMKQVEGK